MKEYKVVRFMAALTKNTEKLEGILNEHAIQGWHLFEIYENYGYIIFEKDKHR